MATFNFENRPNLSLDEVLVGAVPQEAEVAPDEFVLKNLANGFTIVFKSGNSDFAGPTTGPTGGTISEIVVVDATGELAYSVTDIEGSLPSFWNTFKTLGSAAAFTTLLNIKKDDIIHGSEQDDHIGVYGIEGIFLGDAGNDTFIVNEGVLGATLYGTVTLSTNEPAQTDIVEIRGNASIAGLNDIDWIRFGETPTAKTLTLSGNGVFDVKAIQGSTIGADTIKFISGSESTNLDISHLQFVNWGRTNQQILVELNTDATKILDDRFVGSMASERVTAGNGRDLLYGNAGDDYLDGGDGIDVLDGGAGNDTLIGGGGEGPNILKGGMGNDVYKFKDKVDVVIDTGGLDSRMVSKSSTLAAKEMFEGLYADDVLSAGKSVTLTGNAKANILTGHIGKNTLKGMNGNDILDGRGGNDQLDGGAGNDTLYGGLGNDKLTGGAGKDVFYFDTALGASNVDKIISFSTKDDRIALDREIFTALVGAKLSSSAFYIGSKAKDAGDQIIYNKSNGALYYDADGTGAIAAIKFATLDKNLKLSASDFLLV